MGLAAPVPLLSLQHTLWESSTQVPHELHGTLGTFVQEGAAHGAELRSWRNEAGISAAPWTALCATQANLPQSLPSLLPCSLSPAPPVGFVASGSSFQKQCSRLYSPTTSQIPSYGAETARHCPLPTSHCFLQCCSPQHLLLVRLFHFLCCAFQFPVLTSSQADSLLHICL